KNRPGIGRLSEHGGVIEKWIRAPHEGDAIDLAIGFDERQITEFGGELRVRGQLRKIERRGESGTSNGSSDIAGRRADMEVGSAASSQLGHQFVTGAHVGCDDFAVTVFLESTDDGIV